MNLIYLLLAACPDTWTTHPINGGASVIDVEATANPNLLYASTLFDQVKSLNAGATFGSVGINTGQPFSWVANPANPNVVYAWSGYYGAFYRSTNGGANFETIGAPTDAYRVQIVIDPTDPSRIYWVHAEGILQANDPDGTAILDWTPITINGFEQFYLPMLTFTATEMIVTVPMGVFAAPLGSTEMGAPRGQTTFGASSVHWLGGTSLLAVDREWPQLTRSDDSGATWIDLPHPCAGYEETIYDMRIAADPFTPMHIMIACEGELFETFDGGTTFAAVGGTATGDAAVLDVEFDFSGRALLGTSDSGIMARTGPTGGTGDFVPLASLATGWSLETMAIYANSPTRYAAGNGGFYAWDNGLMQFVPRNVGLTPRMVKAMAVDEANDQHVAVVAGRHIYVSHDGGVVWTGSTVPFGTNISALAWDDNGRLIAAGVDGVHISNDDGATFVKPPMQPQLYAPSIAKVYDRLVVAGSSAVLEVLGGEVIASDYDVTGKHIERVAGATFASGGIMHGNGTFELLANKTLKQRSLAFNQAFTMDGLTGDIYGYYAARPAKMTRDATVPEIMGSGFVTIHTMAIDHFLPPSGQRTIFAATNQGLRSLVEDTCRAPIVTSFSPTTAQAGSTEITITGDHLLGGAPHSVLVGEVSGPLYAVGPTSGTALVDLWPGKYPIVVKRGELATKAQGMITVDGTPPSITSVTPASMPETGVTHLRITGTGFYPNSTLAIGSMTQRPFTRDASVLELDASLPPGVYDVSLTNGDGRVGTATNALTVVARPRITTIEPSAVRPEGGETVTITGTAFVSGAQVKIGTKTYDATVSDGALTFTTEAMSTGVFNLDVTNPDGQTDRKTLGLSVNDPVQRQTIVEQKPRACSQGEPSGMILLLLVSALVRSRRRRQ